MSGDVHAGQVVVLGAGTMGSGIAQLVAQEGRAVQLYDVSADALKRARELIWNRLDKRVAEGKMAPEKAASVRAGIAFLADKRELSDRAGIAIEAVVEDLKVKQELFRSLETTLPPDALLASNTTACSITSIAAGLAHPGRVVGMHFFNPPLTMKLVEIMPGVHTDPWCLTMAADFARRLGKTPVIVKRDSTAGIASRVLSALLNEAVWVLHEGLASAEEIDTALRLGGNLPMGPLALIDLIGLDIHLAKSRTLYERMGDLRHRPCPLLEQMVEAGLLGRKAGRGFYDYSG